MTPTLTFVCSICGEPSVSICVYCTKDACPNHVCERCGRCSDCCECDIRLEEHPEPVAVHEEPVAVHEEPLTEEASLQEPAEDSLPETDETETADADLTEDQPSEDSVLPTQEEPWTAPDETPAPERSEEAAADTEEKPDF